MFRICLISILISLTANISAQKEIPLYPGNAPNSKGTPDKEVVKFDREVDTLISKVTKPTLSIFLASGVLNKGSAVIICPGGGYQILLMNREGRNIAREFNKLGISAFVLKYRLPDDKTMTDKSIAPLQDAQRAIQIVRERAGEWNIDPHKIGIMGFSAGGHLAATAGTHFENPVIENKNGTSLRPDFMILIYPLISFTDSLGHIGSRENLLGKTPSKKQILFFSDEYQTSKLTPPAFIASASDDSVVPVANSISFYNALLKNSVLAEMHIYSSGGHGFSRYPPYNEWFGRCINWMKTNGWE